MPPPQQAEVAMTKRPWYRLHLSTWLVGIVGLSIAILVVIPGDFGKFPDYEFTPDAHAIIHGWPATFLWRRPIRLQIWPVEPELSDAWMLTDSVSRLRPTALFLDVALAAAAVRAVVLIYESRSRKRKRAVQFSLRQLLVFATLFAVALGWWNRNRIADRDANSGIEQLEARISAPARMPLWLRGLVGDERLCWLGINQPDSRSAASYLRTNAIRWQPDHIDSIQRVLGRFAEQVAIDVDGDTVKRDLSKLRELPKLQSVFLDGIAASDCRRVLAALENHPGVREVRVECTDAMASEQYLAGISNLPQLETVSITWGSTKSLTELRGCRHLRLLEIVSLAAGNEAIESLGRLRTVSKLKLGLFPPSTADVSGLSALDALEELDLSDSSIPADVARGLVLPRLEYFNIASQFISASALARLLGSGSLPRLKWLCIRDTQLRDRSDELASVFAKLPALETVEIWDTSRPPQPSRDVQKLRNSLPRLEIIADR